MNMEKISKLISKKVIALDSASQVGYVLNVIFDERVKNFTGLIIVDDESENSFVLQREDIHAIGQDTIMIKSVDKMQYNISSATNNPVGKMVYDSQGVCLGRVLDVELQGKTVKKIITNKCEFPQKYIRKSGDNYIIFGLYQKEKPKNDFKEKVSIVNNQILPQVTISQTLNGTIPEMPTRLYANASQLIGRLVTNEILGYNNELIAQKNDIINQKIINKARRHNKLNILNYYSK